MDTGGDRVGEVTRISDEQLEYYGDCFVQWKIRKLGVGFEGFLACPEYYLARVLPSPGEVPHHPLLRWLRRLPSSLFGRRPPSTC